MEWNCFPISMIVGDDGHLWQCSSAHIGGGAGHDIVTCQEKSRLSTIEPRCNSDDDDDLSSDSRCLSALFPELT